MNENEMGGEKDPRVVVMGSIVCSTFSRRFRSMVGRA